VVFLQRGRPPVGERRERAGEAAPSEETVMANSDVTRREVLAKAAYMTPAIVTLPVLLSFASAGSGRPGDKDKNKDKNKDKDKGKNKD
jgi:hypothetical protein